jgi:hypothetical protein
MNNSQNLVSQRSSISANSSKRKVAKPDKAPIPHYSDNQRNYPKPMHNIDSDGCGPPKNWEKKRNYPKPMHSIDSDSCGPPENWEKYFRGPSQERNPRTFDQRSPNTTRDAEL